MASVGNLTTSLINANTELTATLAQLNFDFSVVKVQAPPSYHDLGQAISLRRRTEAEDGSSHKTIRRLTALFQEKIPDTPLLLHAYGKRASEIARHDHINNARQLTKRYGVFEDFIGADATTIWAAATSGKDAIAIHLLACMIARVWKSTEATSIWIELVSARKKEMQLKREQGAQSMENYLASLSELDRNDLAELDNSARAWIRRGDEVQVKRQTQVRLILDNMDIPVGATQSTLANVMEGWTTALIGIEALLRGESQRVHHGGLALALSSWHLYPDLELPGDRRISQNDELFDSSVEVILSLEPSPGQEAKGVYWCLSLAKLRSYGAPKQCVQSFNVESSRLTLEQLKLVVLGCLTKSWTAHGSTLQRACSILVNLHELVFQGRNPIPAVPWLPLLAGAARSFLTTKNENERKMMMKLINLGRNRGQSLLGPPEWQPSLFFGLSESGFFLPLIKSAYDRVRLLRSIASRAFPDADPRDVIIQYYNPAEDNSTSLDDYLKTLFEKAKGRTHQWDGQTIPKGDESEEQSMDNHTPGSGSDSEDSLQAAYEPPELADNSQMDVDSEITSPPTPNRKRKFNERGENEGPSSRGVEVIVSESSGGYDDTMAGAGSATHPPVGRLTSESLLQPQFQAQGQAQAQLQTHTKSVQAKKIPKLSDSRHRHMNWVTAFAGVDGCHDRWTVPIIHTTDGNSQLSTESISCSEHDIRSQEGDTYEERIHGLPQSADFLFRTPSKSWEFPEGHCPFTATQTSNQTCRYELYMGDLHSAAIFVRDSVLRAERRKRNKPFWITKKTTTEIKVRLEDIDAAFKSGSLDLSGLSKSLVDMIRSTSRGNEQYEFWRSLAALAFIDDIYGRLGSATIDPVIISDPLCAGRWFVDRRNLFYHSMSVSREEALACITYHESGLDADLATFKNVMAISSGDSIYVVATLLEDPLERPKGGIVRRILGNVGKPGIVLLVPPPDPMCLEPKPADWKLIENEIFDGELKDSFADTTLHLSFTGDSMPIPMGQMSAGRPYIEAHLLETLVSVHSRGKWIADLDILDAVSKGAGSWDHEWYYKCGCSHDTNSRGLLGEIDQAEITAVNNWEGFLDKPVGPVIIMTHKNWLARLSVVALAVRRHDRVTLSDGFCLKCFEDLYSLGGPEIMKRALFVA